MDIGSNTRGANLFAAISDLLPNQSDYPNLRETWKGDLLAGVTVGIVALPLALAFGVTSGVGASAGIVTAIVAGLVAAIFGGSNLQVSGPTGAMTVVLVPVVSAYGPGAVYALSIMAGFLVLLMGLFRWGKIVNYLPWPVVEGFTVGIATVIGLQQIPLALDVPKPEGDNPLFVALKAVSDLNPTASSAAILLTLSTIALMWLVQKVRPTWPSSLVAVAIFTALSFSLDLQVSTIGELPQALPSFSIPALDYPTLRTLFGSAMAVAALAAIESLLSARVADGLSDQQKSNPDRELFGQGLANIASGFFGGMPATGAIARTAVNIRAGAQTRISAAFHAVILIVAVIAAAAVLAEIPLPVLAGILLFTAFRMVEPHAVRAIVGSTRSDASVFLITALATVLLDLILAVEIGIVIAATLAIRTLAANSHAVAEELNPEMLSDAEAHALLQNHIGIYRIDGALFFGAAQKFLDELTETNQLQVMILRLDFVSHMDATGAATLKEVIQDLQRRSVVVLLKSVKPQHQVMLEKLGVCQLLRSKSDAFNHLADAVAEAERIVRAKRI